MSITDFVGIDPGIVHTGLVHLKFEPRVKTVHVSEEVFAGCPPVAIKTHVSMIGRPVVFIEGYRPRTKLNTDEQMLLAVHRLHEAMPRAQVLLNMGVKKIITRPILSTFDCWNFSQRTHHQDLRSAARILLFGMVKDPQYNELVADVIRDALASNPWTISH